jgi:iron(III) transport system substrate-binding protein
MKSSLRGISMLLCAAACTLLCACGTSAATTTYHAERAGSKKTTTTKANAALAALYKSATKKGKTSVMIYTPSAPLIEPLEKAFMKAYPRISVQAQSLFGPALDSQLQAESVSGKHIGDIILSGDETIGFGDSGKCVRYKPSVSGVNALMAAKTNVVHVGGLPLGIGYNTSAVGSSLAPRGWQALLGGQWKGKLSIEDPTAGGATTRAFSAMLQVSALTPSYLRQLNGQGIALEPTNTQLATDLATGARPVAVLMPYSAFTLMKSEGAPVGFIFPTQGGSILSDYDTCVITGSKHTAAAELFETWLLTTGGGKALAASGLYSVVPGVPGPGGLPAYSKLNLVKVKSLDKQYAYLNTGLATIKQAFSGS